MAAVPEPDPLPGEITVPEHVLVSMAGIAGAAREGLLALAVGTGLQVMTAMFDEDVTRLCGRTESTTLSVAGTGMAPKLGRSPWAAGACR
jgi:hypothetical protein